MPTLTIEDGTGVAGANSFATTAELDTYADNRGLTLPATDDEKKQVLIQAADYLESLEGFYQGWRTHETQVLVFPRDSIYLHGVDIEGTIPDVLKNAQCQLAVDIHGGLAVNQNSTGKEVLEEQVGALKVKYNPMGDSSPQPKPVKALKILEPLFSRATLQGANARVIR